MDGIVVGIVGNEEMLGSGGRVTFGAVGKVGSVGILLGSGGRAPGLGRDGCVVGIGNVGIVGKDGNGGSVAPGNVGIVGKGGNWRR